MTEGSDLVLLERAALSPFEPIAVQLLSRAAEVTTLINLADFTSRINVSHATKDDLESLA